MTAQNKETYLESMNESIKQKYYPEGSVFKALQKQKEFGRGLASRLYGAFRRSIAGLVWSIK